MELGIKNRIALVTGGCSGIGKAIALELAREGATVCVTSRSTEKTTETVDLLDRTNGLQNFGIQSIITDEGEPKRVANEVINRFGTLDIVVNNVGDTLDIMDPYCDLADWNRLFRLILGVAIEINNTAIPGMLARKWGRIVNITAGASYENSGPVPYSSLKAAFTAYSRSTARVLALEGKNVVMSAVLPGVVITEDGHWSKVMETRPEHAEKYLEQRTVLKRFGYPEEISPIVALMASDKASFCIGSVIPVEGGQGRHYFQRVAE